MTQAPQNADNTFRMAGSVTSTKRVYMRNKDMEDYETELETSRQDAENPETDSGNQEQQENTNSAEQTSNDPYEKRFKDLQSFSSKRDATHKKELEKLTQQISELQKQANTPQTVYPTTEEELEEWKKQFPPLYNIMQTMILKEKTVEVDELKDKLKELEEFKQSYANEKGRTELLKLHSDASDFDQGGKRNAEFAQWYNEQEPEIQSLVDSGIPTKIGKAISIFKKDNGIVTVSAQEKKKELSRSVTVGPTKPNLPNEGKEWRESMVAALSPKQYERNQAEIEKARAEGRFVYDISRAN